MPRAIAIQFDSQVIRAVVARGDGDAPKVEAVVSIPVGGGDITVAAKQLAAALEEHHPHKAKVLVAVPSSTIQWQYLTLPPSPAEDLPALVRMQLDLENSREEDPIGYDFLTFFRNESHPQRVLAMVLKVAELARIRNFYRVASLKIESVTPLAMGWTAVGEATQQGHSGTALFVAIQDSEAIIWATTHREIAILRQVQLANADDIDSAANGISGQLRRTLLNLAQEGVAADDARIYLVGDSCTAEDRLVQLLQEHLSNTVDTLPFPEQLLTGDTSGKRELLPLIGLAWEAIQGRKPRLDFLHPRKPPAPRTNRRTYVLATIAAGLLAAVLGWRLYANVYEPVWQAEVLSEELNTVVQEIRPLETEERDASRIQDWLDASPNVLTELARVTKAWRPELTDSPKFSLASDGVLKRIDINDRKIVIAGNVADSSAVQPLENRLRDEHHRVRRERSEPDGEGGKYPWQVQIVVELVDNPPAASVAGTTP